MIKYRRAGGVLSLLLTIAGCAGSKDTTGLTCTDEARAGIAVALQDSITAAKVPFTDVRVIASDGSFRDTSRVTSITGDATSAQSIGLLFERPGTYSVEVTAAGYAPWRIDDITVAKEANECGHVVTQSIVAKLRHL